MSRSLTTPLSNALDDAVVYPFFAVELYFKNETICLWTGYGDLVAGSEFTASISDNTLTVTSVAVGTLAVGDYVSGANINSNTTITSFVSGTGGVGTYTINIPQTIASQTMQAGEKYLGAGTLLNISSVEETTEIEAKGATITLSGIPSTILSLALEEPYQGRVCKIYFGVTSSPSYYVEIFSGELDQMNVVEEAESCTISVTAENVLIKLERPTVRRFTNQDQKSRYPSDRGLEYIASLQDKEIFWGRKAA